MKNTISVSFWIEIPTNHLQQVLFHLPNCCLWIFLATLDADVLIIRPVWAKFSQFSTRLTLSWFFYVPNKLTINKSNHLYTIVLSLNRSLNNVFRSSSSTFSHC